MTLHPGGIHARFFFAAGQLPALCQNHGTCAGVAGQSAANGFLETIGMRILVIEDNPDIAANLGDYLEECGHTVDFAADGVTGLHLAVVQDFDAIVLDLNLPGMDGLDVCRKLRSDARKQTPVLMLTARDSLDNKLAGFDSGADDYLIKPFALQEVHVRLNALVRRARGTAQTRVLRVGDLEYNLDTLEVQRAGTAIQLNPTALKILQALMEASPAVVTRHELESRVWGEALPDSDSLRVHIHGLRAAVDKPFGKPMIQTRHGIGYRIVAPDSDG
jgi:DNA-binding response OmpR family regulator